MQSLKKIHARAQMKVPLLATLKIPPFYTLTLRKDPKCIEMTPKYSLVV